MADVLFDIPFSAAMAGAEIAFDDEIALVAGNSYSQPVNVTGAIAMTIAADPVPGAFYRTQFVANGADVPTITGAIEHSSSGGYDNQAGAINMLRVWHDGLALLYAWSHYAWVTPVLLATASITADDRQILVLTFTGNLDETSVPDASDFTLDNTAGSDPITDVEVSGSSVILTRTRSEDDANVTITYVKGANPIKADATGFDVMPFTDFPVDYEEEGGGLAFIRLTSKSSNVTETANGGGWDYSIQEAVGAYVVCYARSALALQANEDGFFTFTMGTDDVALGPIVGFTSNAAADYYNAMAGGSISINNLGKYGTRAGNGADTTPDADTGAPEAGDVLKVERYGTDLIFSLSKNGGTSFTEFNRETGLTTAALYIFAQFGAYGNEIEQPRISGSWA